MADPLMFLEARPERQGRSSALELVGRSAAAVRLQEFVRRAAALSSGVLLVAEHGAEVEEVARDLHGRSRHASHPFVSVDCGQDGARLDRELFGVPSLQGSPELESVGAESRIAQARLGTLFLNGLGELPAAVQGRMARVARDAQVSIDGQPTTLGWRLVASGSIGIDADVRAHRVRADLCRRVSALRIDLPPLRDRHADIPELAASVAHDFCVDRGLSPRSFTQAASALLGALPWPGNLAELRSVVQRMVGESVEQTIQVEHVLSAVRIDRAPAPFVPTGSLRDARLRFERDYIAAVLQHHGWRTALAAEALGMQRPNLYRKARQLGIPLAKLSQ